MHYKKRQENLQKLLSDRQLPALLVENPINLYYLTGLDLSSGSLLIASGQIALIVDGRYYHACKSGDHHFEVLLQEPDTIPSLTTRWNLPSLAVESDYVTLSRYQALQKLLASIDVKAVSSLVMELRRIKDEHELKLLRAAGKLGSAGYDYVVQLLESGVEEKTIARLLTVFWIENLGEGNAFDPIIAFGPHSAQPHYRSGQGVLKQNDCALIDIGVKKEHYHSDMTRVLFFGQPPEPLRTIYTIVRDAQQAALEKCKAGERIGALDDAARDLIKKAGYGAHFTHGLGHGVGLEIHEPPFLRNAAPYADQLLQPGMVITIEPGIYLPGVGGVRLENTVIVKNDGFEDLTNRFI